MKNINSADRPMKSVGDRFVNIFRSVGIEAWDELKTGIDKAWDEARLGIDEGLQTAAVGFNKAWNEFADGIERAKDSLLLNETSNNEASNKFGSTTSQAATRSRKTSPRDKEKLS